MNKLELLAKYKQEQESKGSGQKFDYEARNWKMQKNGKQRVRILPNIEEGKLEFLTDGYARLSEKVYQDVDLSEGDKNPVRQLLNRLWDDGDEVRKGVYRSIKINQRVTYQIVLLNPDGTVQERVPKLYTGMPKTLHKFIMEHQLTNNVDVTDLKSGFDLVIVKKDGNPYSDYSDSYFVDEESEFDMSEIDEPVALTADKYYRLGDKSRKILSKINQQFSLGLSLFTTTAPAPAPAKEADELDEFEKELLKDIAE